MERHQGAWIVKAAFGIGLVLLMIGCASLKGKKSRASLPDQVEILFKGRAGTGSETVYHSNARTRIYSDGQLTRDHQEIVDFEVASRVTEADDKTITTIVKTTRKDGTVDLHELAFPELGEELDFIQRPTGEVLKAGKYSSNSIFFVPSLPIAGHPVAIGDTWPLEHTWISGHDHIPLKLDVIGILKDIVPCEAGGVCADIEVSGSVHLVMLPTTVGSKFDSRVWGRVLFSLQRGDVIWSEMRSHEEMAVGGERNDVLSCMVSAMKGVAGLPSTTLACDPKEQAVTAVPAL
jgi:hypothetical protein